MTWLRLYTSLLNDPKVQQLSPDLFKAWINILCIAKEHNGFLPTVDEVAFRLRLPIAEVGQVIGELHNRHLLDRVKKGLTPHNWNGRQYISDVSTSRVKRHRERRRNVSVTPPEQSRTDTEQITEQNTEQRNGADAPALSDRQKAFNNWNKIAEALNLPQAQMLSKERQRKLDSRLKEVGLKTWNAALRNIEEMPFCCGQNDRGWKVSLDWLLSPTNFNKILEKVYAREEKHA